MIELSFNELRLLLNPEVGGSVAAFMNGKTPLLRPAKAGTTKAIDQAAYPLIPFSGRINQGKFRFNNKEIALPSNMPPEPHAIHGQGWQSAWYVVSQNDHAATIAFDYTDSDWPWRYRAEQLFELGNNTLTLTMNLQNLSPEAMPAGLGWHPFFPKQNATLIADVSLIWPSGEDMISQPPIDSETVEQLNTGVAVNALTLDNAFSTFRPQAHIRWPGESRAIELQASEELAHLVIYTPPNRDFFCVEPVSHAPNCLNSTLPATVTGARTLAANETMSAQIKLTVT